jgi:hypothetical protein
MGDCHRNGVVGGERKKGERARTNWRETICWWEEDKLVRKDKFVGGEESKGEENWWVRNRGRNELRAGSSVDLSNVG